MNSRMREHAIIIGGGIAGLCVERELRKKHGLQPVILEASSRAGGRVKSVYDSDGALMYEVGAWRIAHSHTRTIMLLEELDVKLRPCDTPSVPKRVCDAVPGLSTWDVDALNRRSAFGADYADLASGYADFGNGASGANDETDSFWVADEGLEKAVQVMASSAKLFLNTRVVDVQRASTDYIIQCRCKEEGDKFVNRLYRSAVIFICVPPHAAERWTIVNQWGRAQLYAVMSSPLHRICAQTKSAPAESFHVRSPTSILGQSTSSAHSAWMQPSYTGGRLARFWHRLRISQPGMFLAVIKEELWNVLSIFIETERVQSHYFEHGYHMWRPVPVFSLSRAVEMSLMLNPRHLPNVFWAGEAYSSFQGWVEGAIETAQKALAIFTGKAAYILSKRAMQVSDIVIEGRILDAKTWMRNHPGGESALRRHFGNDATDMFYHARHSNNAWAIVFSMQSATQAR